MSNDDKQSSNRFETSPEKPEHTLNEILQMGEEAARLLGSPVFQWANKLAVDTAIMEWVNTLPKEREKRESLWNEVQAHGRINSILKGLFEQAVQEAGKQAATNELDDQGFGLTDGYPTK